VREVPLAGQPLQLVILQALMAALQSVGLKTSNFHAPIFSGCTYRKGLANVVTVRPVPILRIKTVCG